MVHRDSPGISVGITGEEGLAPAFGKSETETVSAWSCRGYLIQESPTEETNSTQNMMKTSLDPPLVLPLYLEYIKSFSLLKPA